MLNLKKALEIILESNQKDPKFEYDNMGQIINLNKELFLSLIEKFFQEVLPSTN